VVVPESEHAKKLYDCVLRMLHANSCANLESAGMLYANSCANLESAGMLHANSCANLESAGMLRGTYHV